jgi:hypothetical protein
MIVVIFIIFLSTEANLGPQCFCPLDLEDFYGF